MKRPGATHWADFDRLSGPRSTRPSRDKVGRVRAGASRAVGPSMLAQYASTWAVLEPQSFDGLRGQPRLGQGPVTS